MSKAPRVDAIEAITNTVQPRPNYIINGGFDFWQRGILTSGNTENAQNEYFADRFAYYSQLGLTRSLYREDGSDGNFYFHVGRGSSVTMTNDTLNMLYQTVEGVMSPKNLSGKNFTLSFKVKTSVAGQHGISIRNLAGNRSYLTTYTVSQADVIQDISIVIPFEVGTYDVTSNNAALVVRWGNGVGTNFQGVEGWQDGDKYGLSNQVVLFSDGRNGDYFEITNVKLEEGDTATDFVRAGGTYAGELALCQRYYRSRKNGFTSQLGGLLFRAVGTSEIRTMLDVTPKMRTETPSVLNMAGAFYQLSNGAFVSPSISSASLVLGPDLENSNQAVLSIMTDAVFTNTVFYSGALTFNLDAEL